jgi:hypothetical protein
MKLKILRFRMNAVYRLSKVADKIFCWGCERHTKLYKQFMREIKGDLK